MDQLKNLRRAEELLNADSSQLLPKGWRREEIAGRRGLNAHKYDVIYYSPNGQKFTTKAQMQRFFGPTLDLSVFDFRSGRLNLLALKREDKRNRNKSLNGPSRVQQPTKGNGGLISTGSQLTVVRTQTTGKVNTDLRPTAGSDRPRQIFWCKRLEQLVSDDIKFSGVEALSSIRLPDKMKAVGPNVNDVTAWRTVAAAFQMNKTHKIVGQSDQRIGEQNASVFVDPNQPLISPLIVNDDVIRRQEQSVRQARIKLSLAYSRDLID
jgi:hypothetical protein